MLTFILISDPIVPSTSKTPAAPTATTSDNTEQSKYTLSLSDKIIYYAIRHLLSLETWLTEI